MWGGIYKFQAASKLDSHRSQNLFASSISIVEGNGLDDTAGSNQQRLTCKESLFDNGDKQSTIEDYQPQLNLSSASKQQRFGIRCYA